MIEEEMNFPYEFISPIDIDIEETTIGVAMIKGTLLAEGISRNKNYYTIDVMEEIAKSAEGKPIYVGIMRKPHPDTGVMLKSAHANIEENYVGRIIQTFVDKVARKIKFIASIVNTEKFPKLIEEVKQGWGVSIGGQANARWVLDSLKRTVMKILGMTVTHVQLIAPEVVRGQDEAQVEDVEPCEIEETMMFYEVPEIKIVKIKLGHGIKSVRIIE